MNKAYLLVISDNENSTIETVALSENKALELSQEFVRRWNVLHNESAELEEFEIRSDSDFRIVWQGKLIKRWRSKDKEYFFDVIEVVPEKLEIV